MKNHIPAQPDFSKIKTVIFDFDGTLIDTLDIFVDTYNTLAPRFHCKYISREDQARLRGKRPQEFFHEYHISLWKLPALVGAARRLLKNTMRNLELEPAKRELLAQVKAKGYRLGILSSNTEETIRHILAKHNLEDLFDFIVTGKNLFGKDRAMKRILRRQHLKPQEVVYIGDETRDVEAMHRIGISIIAVGWGYSAPEALQKLHPTYMVHSLGELQELFN